MDGAVHGTVRLFFVGIGALRRPDHWERLLAEIAASPALQVVTGLVEMAIGGVVYLANPWDSADWLSSALAVVGGLLVLEALAIIAFSDIYLAFWVRRFGPLARLWAWCSIAVGGWRPWSSPLCGSDSGRPPVLRQPVGGARRLWHRGRRDRRNAGPSPAP
ncbi:hypothetical protein ACFSTD_23955 [Novosphingobium colocasiae]